MIEFFGAVNELFKLVSCANRFQDFKINLIVAPKEIIDCN
jgi:hypothetical protein